jgi:hypothetical protein
LGLIILERGECFLLVWTEVFAVIN